MYIQWADGNTGEMLNSFQNVYFYLKVRCVLIKYTAKNAQPVQGCCAAHIVHSCQQCCSALLTTMSNVGSKTLNNAVLTALNWLCVFTRVGLSYAANVIIT